MKALLLTVAVLLLLSVDAINIKQRLLGKAKILTKGGVASELKPGESEREWDTDDGGTAVILYNDNSVSQTWDDKEGRKILQESHQKSQQEEKQKHRNEMAHKTRAEQDTKKALADPKHNPGSEEERSKAKITNTLKQAQSEFESKHREAKSEEKEKQSKFEEEDKKQAEKQQAALAEQRMRFALQDYAAVSQFSPSQRKELLPVSAVLPSAEYSYAWWIQPKSTVNAWSNIFHHGDTNEERSPAVFFHPDSFKLHVRFSTQANANDGTDPEMPLVQGQWAHVVLTVKENEARVYIDGQMKSFSAPGAIRMNPGTLWGSDPWYEAAKAVVSDLRYYRRVLTQQEIDFIRSENKHI